MMRRRQTTALPVQTTQATAFRMMTVLMMMLMIMDTATVPRATSSSVFVLGLVPPMPVPPVPVQVPIVQIMGGERSMGSSSMILSGASVEDGKNGKALLLKSLEEETKAAEKLAKEDAKRAKAELKREKFFEYDAKMAKEAEQRIEQAEQQAIDEAIRDQKLLERLQALEKTNLEELEANGSNLTKQQKERSLKEAKKIKEAEKALIKREQEALKRERVFLAEEIQEQKLLQQKMDAERRVSSFLFCFSGTWYFICLCVMYDTMMWL